LLFVASLQLGGSLSLWLASYHSWLATASATQPVAAGLQLQPASLAHAAGPSSFSLFSCLNEAILI